MQSLYRGFVARKEFKNIKRAKYLRDMVNKISESCTETCQRFAIKK
jgi:hypothetical protein